MSTAAFGALCIFNLLVLLARELDARPPGVERHNRHRFVKSAEFDSFERARSHKLEVGEDGNDAGGEEPENGLSHLIKELESSNALQDEESPSIATDGQRTPSVGMAIVDNMEEPVFDEEITTDTELTSEALQISSFEQQKNELQQAVEDLERQVQQLVNAGAEEIYPRETVEEDGNDETDNVHEMHSEKMTEEDNEFEDENQREDGEGEITYGEEHEDGDNFEEERAHPSYIDGVEGEEEKQTSEEAMPDEVIPEDDGEAETEHEEEMEGDNRGNEELEEDGNERHPEDESDNVDSLTDQTDDNDSYT